MLLCVLLQAYAPYERPALTKGYLFPLDKKPARLPGFHTCVGSGGERQTPDWYKEQGIEMLYEDPVTGCTASRFPEKIGGNLPGVHYIRDVADADSLISSLEKARRLVVVGGGYIGMEIIFPEDHLLQRLFTPSLARKYEELYQENGVKFLKKRTRLLLGLEQNLLSVPFERVGLNTTVGGIQVDGQFRTSVPGILAVGDVAAFPLKMYDRIARVEHVDHARRSAQHCVKALLSAQTHTYDYLPYFYSRVFEYEGSPRKVWWQFFGDNVGETLEIGKRVIYTQTASNVVIENEFQLLPKLARSQPSIDKAKLQNASTVEEALEIAQASLQGPTHCYECIVAKAVLKMDLHDDKDKHMVMRIVASIPGIESVFINMNEKKLTVTGDIDPVFVVSKLRNKWHTEILTVGPAKEPEKKKEEPKKEEAKKDEGKKDEDKKKDQNEEIAELVIKPCITTSCSKSTHEEK
ncbi:hypothetical protein F0562_013190 [Nyssa sinensis]|uniref:HMA domain-containing protein n=1 Tax=Nyssa sinensis TaxID=561372 RepID=A0A5J4ZWG7_9ASTE|nr:hypothetical protein F0562_013190 [Nyssa sinensis]